MEERIRMEGVSQSIRNWAKQLSEVNRSIAPLLQEAADIKKSPGFVDMANTFFLMKQTLHRELNRNNQIIFNHLDQLRDELRASLKQVSLAMVDMVDRYYESIKPLATVLNGLAVSQQSNQLDQEEADAPSEILNIVAAYAEHNPSAIVVGDTGEETRIIDQVNKLRTAVEGLHVQISEIQDAGKQTEKRGVRISITLFILSVLIPQLLFGGGAAEQARKELYTGIYAIIDKFQNSYSEIVIDMMNHDDESE